jgi:uncharacterized protein (UPF0333 family)
MAGRLGNVILWVCVLAAVVWMVASFREGGGASKLAFEAAMAAVVVAIGIAARYVLGGSARA